MQSVLASRFCPVVKTASLSQGKSLGGLYQELMKPAVFRSRRMRFHLADVDQRSVRE
jgi:hypothetical protein